MHHCFDCMYHYNTISMLCIKYISWYLELCNYCLQIIFMCMRLLCLELILSILHCWKLYFYLFISYPVHQYALRWFYNIKSTIVFAYISLYRLLYFKHFMLCVFPTVKKQSSIDLYSPLFINLCKKYI